MVIYYIRDFTSSSVGKTKLIMEQKECPHCSLGFGDWQEGEYFDRCNNCGYEEDKREQLPLYAPNPFDYNKEYRMETVDEKYGYIFYFKEGETKLLTKEPHIHIRGHGREIQYFLSPFQLKKKIPKNFPKGEESKLEKWAYERRHEYLKK